MRTFMTPLFITATLLAAACTPEPEEGIGDQVITHQVDNDSTEATLPEGAMDSGLGGTVLHADGTPVVGAFIQAECIGEPCPAIPDLGVLTGESGHFRWPLPPGRLRIVARLENDVSAPVEVRVLDAGTPPVELTLDNSTR